MSTPRVAAHPFDIDTAGVRLGSRRHAVEVSDRWGAFLGRPNGGYLMAICLRALATEVALPDPLTSAAFFHRPAGPGPAEVQVELVRRGRRSTTGMATLVQRGLEVARVLATFGDLERAAGRTATFASPPGPADPEQAHDLDPTGVLPDAVTIAQRFDYRVASPHGWRVGRPSGDPALEFAIRFREPRHADSLSLPVFTEAGPRAVVEIGEGGAVTLELTLHVRARPAPGWLRCRVATRHVRDGYHEEDFEAWDSAGRLVAQSRQLGLLMEAAH